MAINFNSSIFEVLFPDEQIFWVKNPDLTNIKLECDSIIMEGYLKKKV